VPLEWTSPSFFPWRAPLRSDWSERWTTLDERIRALGEHSVAEDYDAIALEARFLANQALGSREQLKLGNLAQRMMTHVRHFSSLRHFRIGLIGNRTLSYLVAPLRAAGLARGLLLEALEVPYDRAAVSAYAQSFASEAGQLDAHKRLDAAVIVLDEGAFVGLNGQPNDECEARAFADADAFLLRLARSASEGLEARVIVASIPFVGSHISSSDSALTGSTSRFLMHVNNAIIAGARDLEWVMWDLAALASQVGINDWFDPVRFHEVNAPFRIELGPLVADHLCRTIAAITGKSGRALVVDLDNTLWGGVIGDDGISGIRLGRNSPEGEAYLGFQQFLLNLRQRGIVVAVSSKNTDAVAREPFRRHPEMLLREEHIAVFQANWEDKATNLKAIAEALDLGLESLVFIDDNPAERERVRQELPLVSVPEIGSEPALYSARIADSGLFEHLLLTADDRMRAESYQTRAAAAVLKERIGNYDEYLESLKMKLTVSRFDAIGRARILQLVNRSNQFNLTTRRYNDGEIRLLEENTRDVLCWQARLEDAFGQHGIIGVVVVRKTPQVWTIDTWLMSCRVLSRGVEDALMNLLMADARDAGVETIIGEYIPSSRNALVSDFYRRMGFETIPTEQEIGSGTRYRAHTATHSQLKSFIAINRT
jgi:FkbH-like protein